MTARGDLSSACLGDETIVAMLEGTLPDDATQRARTHITSCDACRQMVSAAVDANVSPTSSGPPRHGTITPGDVIANKYRIDRMLGQGGGGRVYIAHQLGLERPVAIKVLHPELARDTIALKRFHREARLVAALVSDHVVRVHDLGELATGEPYLVMELLEGEDLAKVIERGPVPLAQSMAWILSACDAIGEAHALGIVHRDIKPSNLFVTRQYRLKVLDFGLAKLALAPAVATASMTGVGIVLGSPRYMAPEQILGARDVDARADIWALGATFYHLVAGRPPFAEEGLEAIFASILAGTIPPLEGLPPELAPVIQRALARDPAARFASAGELAHALRAATSPTPAARGLGGSGERAGNRARSRSSRSGSCLSAASRPSPTLLAAPPVSLPQPSGRQPLRPIRGRHSPRPRHS